MTPFGAKMRELRAKRGLTLTDMAADLHISPAYLSALEHGRRGQPTPGLVKQICAYFNIIWDEAEELEELAARSHPRVVVDTGGLSPAHTELANRLADRIGELDEDTVTDLLARLDPGPDR